MPKASSKRWQYRVLLTDTLPYEVPVTFSNEKLLVALSGDFSGNADLQKALNKLFAPSRSYTSPYDYNIRKDEEGTTRLSVVHPMTQVHWCTLYSQYEGTLLSYCAKSEFSIRMPVAVADVYIEETFTDGEGNSKTGAVQVHPADNEFDSSHITSYFVYEKYNLLGKFFESADFYNQEKRFPVMRSLDISKCFYHIYTHTIGWAVKGKEFTKRNIHAHSFEKELDTAMQRANHNETNGIIVGPEFSRIFAEIILQQVDLAVQRELYRAYDMTHNRDYSVRRYVDDYSIFSTSVERLDTVESVLEKYLERYKLYLNRSKTTTQSRPFVTNINLVRSELFAALESIDAEMQLADENGGSIAKSTRQMLKTLREMVRRNDVAFVNISGLLLGKLRSVIHRVNASLDKAPLSDAKQEAWLDRIRALLELAFYVCSVDLRVRTTYTLCQITKSVFSSKSKLRPDLWDQVDHLMCEEIGALTKVACNALPKEDDCIELYNILICGSLFIGTEFSTSAAARTAFEALLQGRLSYFRFAALKVCFLTSKTDFASHLASLNDKAKNEILTGDVRLSSEHFLMLCDYLSSPDVETKDKREVFVDKFGGSISNSTVESLAEIVGFTDWSGVSVDHALKRKEFRPVYGMA